MMTRGGLALLSGRSEMMLDLILFFGDPSLLSTFLGELGCALLVGEVGNGFFLGELGKALLRGD